MPGLPKFDEVFRALIDVTEDKNQRTIDRLAALRKALAPKRRGPESAAPIFPDLDAPDFHRRLQAIRNFYVFDNAKKVLTESGVHERTLMRHQRFVKAYMSPGTGYNGMLLVHAVGWGKTCSAITVAEMYRSIMRKPALVLTKVNVRAEFENELGNADLATWSAQQGWALPLGCGGAQYQRVVAMVKEADPRRVKEALDKITARNYKFSGYEEFSNEAERLWAAGGEAAVRAEYSDRVIVVDEAHNLRADNKYKRSADLLTKVVEMCSNVKLLLLSATPMFDKPQEIAYLLNLLRLNDGRSVVDASKLFDADGGLVDEAGLESMAQGYVSFVHGSDAGELPMRVPGHAAMGLPPFKWPKRTSHGALVEEAVSTPVFPCILSPEHSSLVRALMGNPGDGDDDDDDEDSVVANRLGPASQASNAAYRTASGLKYGDRGLEDAFVRSTVNGVVQYSHRDPKYRPFSRESIGDLAPKLANIASAVLQCEGISFVYSYWIYGGAIPMALALEEHGFERLGGTPLLSDRPRAAGVAPKYILITGNADLMPMSAKEAIRIATRKNNSEGGQVRVIIGSISAMEGINFQCVRAVHIMDAWWNSARPEQVVGRAIRLKSHRLLPAAKRNVSVFYHGALLGKGVEGIDHYMYRKAGVKQEKVSRVLRVLRDTSVDCAWNHAHARPTRGGEYATVRSSQGRTIRMPAGPKDGDPECFYSKCAQPCKHRHLLAPASAGARLVEPLQDDVDGVRAGLQAAFLRTPRIRHEQIRALFPGVEPDLLDHCLARLLETGARLNGGRLALFGDVYVVDASGARVHPRSFAATLPSSTEASASAALAALADFEAAAKLLDGGPYDAQVHDAAVDRASMAELLLFARSPRSNKFRQAMARGGLLVAGKVVYHPGTDAAVTLSGNEVDRPAASTEASTDDAEASVSRAGVFRLGGARDCASYSTAALWEHWDRLKAARPASTTAVTKLQACNALELHLRKLNKVLRPGLVYGA
jgi:hypothetical protein